MSRSMYSVAGNDHPGVVVTFTPNGPATLARDRRHWHVNTWADGHGRWHAEFSDTDDTPAVRLARVARLAIAHELDQRADAARYGTVLPHVRVVRMYRRTDLPGHVHYAERDDDAATCDHCGAVLVAEDCPNYGYGPEHA